MSSRAFLRALWPEGLPEGTAITISLADPAPSSWHSLHYDSLDLIPEPPQDKHVYFGVASRERGLEEGARGKAHQLRHLPALWVDVDTAEGEHSKKTGLSKGAALQILRGMRLGPSIIIDTGGGLHAYWLLDALYSLGEPTSRQLAADLSRQFQDAVRTSYFATVRDAVDSTHDLGRSLRLPGSRNVKTPEAPQVLIVDLHEDRRYDVGHILETMQIQLEPRTHDNQALSSLDTPLQTWRLREALSYISPADYHRWTQVGMALRLHGEEYFSEWVRWAHDEPNKLEVHREKWETFASEPSPSQRLVTVDTIYSWAEKAGWKGNRRPTLTEDGNAEILRREHGDGLRWTRAIGWLEWTDRGWQRVDEEQVRALALELADDQAHEVDEARSKHGLKMLTAAKARAVTEILKSKKPIHAHGSGEDTTPHLLRYPSGMVDLRTGEQLPIDREVISIACTNVDYFPEAKAPRWEAFFEEIFSPVEGLAEEVRLALGYTLTGEFREEVLFIAKGWKGQNGKSTLLSVLSSVLGDYATAPAVDPLLTGHRGGRERAYVPLVGRRMAIYQEPPAGARLDASVLKSATGGDELQARELYREAFTFVNRAKLWLACNEMPSVDGGDQGLERRLLIVPFLFRPSRRDRDLKATLEREREGILAWLVRAAQDYYAGGLETTKMKEAADEVLQLSDPIQDWLDTMDQAAGSWGAEDQLYRSYRIFMDLTGHKPWSRARWRQHMLDRGYSRRRADHGGRRVYGFADIGLPRGGV